MDYDVLLIHPPATYDFRRIPQFGGPMSITVGRSTNQFIAIPLGMLSIAEYLDRNGYKVMVDNLGERMVLSEGFDPESHLRSIEARVYGIGLHWCVHAQGAVEVARLCKRLHPNSTVIVGGLTATIFHREIIERFGFIDAIIRGEGEKPTLQLVDALDRRKQIKDMPSTTSHDRSKVSVAPLMKPSHDLDEFEFTRLDLLEPKDWVYASGMPPHWILPVCRGCTFNCVACGGSAYSYKTYLGMERPAFRSPGRLVEDIQRLVEQGIRHVGLHQDPQIGGKKYWTELLEMLQKERTGADRISIDLFTPAGREFINRLSLMEEAVTLTISPESGNEDVRRAHGRPYSNRSLIKTLELCHERGIPLAAFFMVGLAQETRETIKDTWKLFEELCRLDLASHFGGLFREVERQIPVAGPLIGPMILLDPGSLAFDFPQRHGYRLLFRDLSDFIEGLSTPSWHQWINYETRFLDRNSLVEIILDSMLNSVICREKYFPWLFGKLKVIVERFQANAQRQAIDDVDQALQLPDLSQRTSRIRTLKEAYDELRNALDQHVTPNHPYSFEVLSSKPDPYGFRRKMKEILHLSVGLTDGGPWSTTGGLGRA